MKIKEEKNILDLKNIEISFDIIKGKRTAISCENEYQLYTLLSSAKELNKIDNIINYENLITREFNHQYNCFEFSDFSVFNCSYGEFTSTGYNVIDFNTFLHLNELINFCYKNNKMFFINNAVLIMNDYIKYIKILENKKRKNIDYGLGL